VRKNTKLKLPLAIFEGNADYSQAGATETRDLLLCPRLDVLMGPRSLEPSVGAWVHTDILRNILCICPPFCGQKKVRTLSQLAYRRTKLPALATCGKQRIGALDGLDQAISFLVRVSVSRLGRLYWSLLAVTGHMRPPFYIYIPPIPCRHRLARKHDSLLCQRRCPLLGVGNKWFRTH